MFIVTSTLGGTNFLWKQQVVNIGHHAAIGNGNITKKLAQFFIVSNSQLNMPWHNSSLLVVPYSISSQFKNLSKSALTSTISLLPNSNLDKSVCNKSNAKRDTQQIIQPYLSDISDYLRTMEMQEKRRPAGDYMDKVQRCITTNMRRTLVDWLVEVADEYKLLPETLHLAVSYIDRFLSIHSLNRSKLQLLGVSAMLIASKYEEITPPKAVDFYQITDNTYELHEA
ncbi:hypothetical protein KIW84_062761 [Lathyrus oleraceus]|uniref:B-like cyclin n=1 Tax=Pisum sativum TaxID=3888 RepID=A0A9D5A5Y5_PEA|nr:hypothetical protein KIW84_062761 [Pisum sativum]